jgi:Tol biopolymer transport system component
MIARCVHGCGIIFVTLLACVSTPASGQSLQLVSTVNPDEGPPAGGSGDSWAPLISPDGRYVLFASAANNLLLTTNQMPIPGGFPLSLNVFLRDRIKGMTSLVSVDLTGLAGGNDDSLPLGISTNGQYALFESRASNLLLTPADGNGAADIFLRDLVNGTTILVSGS